MTADKNTENEDSSFESEYIEVEKLKQKLLNKYDGKKVEDIDNGEEILTDKGSVFKIKNTEKIKLEITPHVESKKQIILDLKLIKGIGDAKMKKLKDEGYKTIEDLQEHPTFSEEARRFMSLMDSCNVQEIVDNMCCKYPKSHPLVLGTSSFSEIEDFMFLDIETLGFSNVPIILLGEAQVSDNKITVNQYLLREKNEENIILSTFLSRLKDNSVYVTFNGSTFDIPFIKSRLYYYQMNRNITRHHFDLMHFSRRFWGDELPNCKLTTIEKHLFGIEREDDVPSGLVPGFYKTYLKTDNIGPLIPIVEHNRQDIVTLAMILSKLHEHWE